MNNEESNDYLRKMATKWQKLGEKGQEEYENLHKKQKKELKKSIKKFLLVILMIFDNFIINN